MPGGNYVVAVSDNTGKISALSGTTEGGSLALSVIAGSVDVNGDGTVDGADDGTLKGPVDFGAPGLDATSVRIIDGKLDLNGDGTVDALDGGTFAGVAVIAGQLDINGVGGITAADNWIGYPVTVAGANVSGAHFGYNIPGAIGDTVWSDSNGNGTRDAGEVGIDGVVVYLYRDANANVTLESGTDVLISTQVTDSNGNYLFEGIAQPGTYFVSVDGTQATLNGYTLTTTDDQAAAGTQRTVALTNVAATNLGADFGYQKTTLPEVTGLVWNDQDENGVFDVGEPRIPGVTVVLLDTNGDLVAATTTDGSGIYTFYDVVAGNYTVHVTDDDGVLKGYTLTSGLDAIATTVAATTVSGINFGYARKETTGSIGSTVWLDANADGAFQPNESGLAGVSLNLYRPGFGPDGIPGNGDDANVVATTATDVNGNYQFAGLPAGTYVVDVITGVPAGLQTTVGTTDPTGSIVLALGQTYTSANFGYAPATNTCHAGRSRLVRHRRQRPA